jgi:NitT/TauT family transport system substrate-binding protein
MTLARRRSLLLAAAALPVGAPAFAQRRPVAVSTQLSWLRNGEFAALMVAEAKGFFEAEGIQHRIVDGGPGRNSVPTVAAGQAQFGLSTSGLHLLAARTARDPVDIVAVGALYQKTPAAYLTIANAGDPEPTPKSLENRSVGIQAGSEYFARAMARINGADESKIRIVTVQANAEPLLVGRVDFFNGWVTNQAFQIELEAAKPDAPPAIRGRTWKAIRFSDWGLNAYADVIFATRRTVQENPDLVRAYLRAVAQGIRYILDNPAETVDLVARFPGQIENAEKLAWRWRVQNPLFVSEETARAGLLAMTAATWTANSQLLREANEIPRQVPPDEVMTTALLPGLRPA